MTDGNGRGEHAGLMTTEQLAEFLSIGLGTVRNHSTRIPGRRLIGRLVRFDITRIHNWVDGTPPGVDLWDSAKDFR